MVAVGVIGSGAWGTTLALLLAQKGIAMTLWEHRPERAAEMQRARENTLFLPGFHFPDGLHVTANIIQAVQGKDMLLLVTPSQRMRENVRLIAPYVGTETLLVSASKGIEVDTLKRMTEIIAEEIPEARSRIAALSGPNISREVAEGKPTAAVVAAQEQDVAVRVRTLLSTSRYRVYTSTDVVGVELGGALKIYHCHRCWFQRRHGLWRECEGCLHHARRRGNRPARYRRRSASTHLHRSRRYRRPDRHLCQPA